jgi:NAD(P)-dependent dehydrogenase (short-subunit alcohol dehydrogenase family)
MKYGASVNRICAVSLTYLGMMQRLRELFAEHPQLANAVAPGEIGHRRTRAAFGRDANFWDEPQVAIQPRRSRPRMS